MTCIRNNQKIVYQLIIYFEFMFLICVNLRHLRYLRYLRYLRSTSLFPAFQSHLDMVN